MGNMIKTALSVARQFLFWLIFFAFCRAIFLVYYSGVLADSSIPPGEVIKGFWFALRLDAATASYIMVIPAVLTVIQSVSRFGVFQVLNKSYSLLMIIVYSLIATAEIGIYDEWKTKMNPKALNYLNHPGEIYASAPTFTFIVLLALLAVQTAAGFYAYNRFFFTDLRGYRGRYIPAILLVFLFPAILFMGMRGGIQEIPITQSQSYYSKHNILNLAATNSGFNFLHGMNEYRKNFNANPYLFMDHKRAAERVEEMHTTATDTTVVFLGNRMPNIVLIIMESWSADLIESLGAMEGITPEFRDLEKEGLLFTNIYTSGSRSEQGVASIFSGFPAHPFSVVTYQPGKYTQLPSLNLELKNRGYFSSFYFGGQLIYGNIKSYIYYNGFDRIRDIEDMPQALPRGKLGIHDAWVFREMTGDLENDPRPFISVIFTSSTHSPFDMPMILHDFWDEKYQNLYLNSAHYTDSCLGAFIDNARMEEWYENTLFIVTPDHSHDSYKKWPYHSPQYHKTFFLFYGNVLKQEFRGKQIDRIGSQTDLAATLLAQLGMEHDQFRWSKNLMNPGTPEFASISFEEGIGWVSSAGSFFYEPRFERFYYKEPDPGIPGSVITDGKAYLQVLFQEYLDY